MSVSSTRRPPRFVYLGDGDRSAASSLRYGWRLVAANYRALGRARLATSDLDECRDAAFALHKGVDELETGVISNRGVWTWQVGLGGVTSAVSVHSYMRRVECARGLSQFLDAVRIARPEDGVVRYFGANSLRAYEIGESLNGARK